MSQRLEIARERLAESLAAGEDTGPLRRAIEQVECNERNQAEASAAIEADRAAAACEAMALRVATAFAEICESVKVVVAPVDQPQVQVQTSPALEFAVRRAIELQDALDAVTTTCADRSRDSAALADRLAETRKRMADWRAKATIQALTETQAASFNLAILDEADLVHLLAAAQTEVTRASLAVNHAQTAQAAAATYLTGLWRGLKVDALRTRAAALEALLIGSVEDLWRACRENEPTVRFLKVWRATQALERAVIHHQPPNGGIG